VIDFAGIVAGQDTYVSGTSPSTVYITDNQILQASQGASAVLLYDYNTVSTLKAVVSGNTILNSYVGVWVNHANGVQVTGNVIKNSAEYGIAVTDGSSNNLIAHNIVMNSGVDDLYWDGTGTGNVWIANQYQTSSPPGLG
jgi:parallel beta-helix repeat protein